MDKGIGRGGNSRRKPRLEGTANGRFSLLGLCHTIFTEFILYMGNINKYRRLTRSSPVKLAKAASRRGNLGPSVPLEAEMGFIPQFFN